MLIVVTDIETTGLLAPDHRIIETCVNLYDYNPVTHDFTKVKSSTRRIDPQRSIDPKAQAVHGITPTDLIGKPKWIEVAQAIRDELSEGEYIVGQNLLAFDAPFYLQEFARVGVADPDGTPFDTMLSGRQFTPLGKAPSLQELCFASGIEYNPEEAHSAEYDVGKTAECFFFGLKIGAFSL